jgi:hypothetical protein
MAQGLPTGLFRGGNSRSCHGVPEYQCIAMIREMSLGLDEARRERTCYCLMKDDFQLIYFILSIYLIKSNVHIEPLGYEQT